VSGTITVRPARPADEAGLLACARSFHAEDGHPLPQTGEQALVAMLSPAGASEGRILVLVRDAHILGYAVLCFGYSVEYGGRDAFVDDIYVVPELRGGGYGDQLYTALEAEARAGGCHALHLEVMPGNRMLPWYRRLGYRDRGSLMLSKRL
jgi:GNAT superfamily N-acetyltransferase